MNTILIFGEKVAKDSKIRFYFINLLINSSFKSAFEFLNLDLAFFTKEQVDPK